MKRIIVFLFLINLIFAQEGFYKINSKPGAFTRIGASSKSIAMGNSTSAFNEGALIGLVNPALSVFQKGHQILIDHSFLSLDRKFNLVSYTKKFNLDKKNHIAGLSIGLINSGVSNIGEYDLEGTKLGEFSTSENLIFVSIGNKVSEKFVVGVTFKFYFYNLFQSLTASALGFDVGIIYKLNDKIFISAMLKDINARYTWDTTEIWGVNGNSWKEKFPLAKKIGLAYKFSENLVITGEYENLDSEINFLRCGAQYKIIENLYLRAGIDRLNLSDKHYPTRPSFGFSYNQELIGYKFIFDYAYSSEPYSAADRHSIGINLNL